MSRNANEQYRKDKKTTMIYTYENRVRYSEIDEYARMTLFALVNNMQDTCTFQGEDIGLGLAHNTGIRRAWIIANIQTHIERYPVFGEKIVVTTWASGFRSMIATRRFDVHTSEGELLCEANTEWLFMDLDTRMPVRIPQDQVDKYGLHPDRPLTYELGKRKIRIPDEGEEQEHFVIQEHHLDTNRHVNNAQYIRLSQRYLPLDFIPHHMRVEFKKQALLDDLVIPRYTVGEDGTHYVALKNKDGEDFFTAEFR